MKFKTTVIRLIFIVILMFVPCHEIFAQETDSIKFAHKGIFVGLSLGPSQSQVVNAGMLSLSGLVNSKMNAVTGSVDVGYSFSDYFGLSTGISYGSFNGRVTLTSYQNKFNTTDSENEAYERQVSGTNIKEDQTIAFLGVPVWLNFGIPFNKRTGLSVRAGIEMAVPIKKNYHSGGIFTYKGYYPKYNVLLENLPAYGFPTNAVIATDGVLELNPFCIGASVAAGIDFFITRMIQSSIAVCYTQSLSGIQAYASPEKFQLSSDAVRINSLMGGSSKATDRSTGLKISLRYYLSRH